MFASDTELPEVDFSDLRLEQMLGEIKRNSRNRRIVMFAPLVLAAAVLSAMIAAPPQHGGLALADAEDADPQLPRVFGSNGVWRLAEPIAEAPAAEPGPAAMIEAPTLPDGPVFVLTPPTPEELISLPTSTSTPPTSTSGQSPAAAADVTADTQDPAELDWSSFNIAIRIEPQEADVPASVDSPQAEQVAEAQPKTSSTPDPHVEDTITPDSLSDDGDVTVAVLPQAESDPGQANPSSPEPDQADPEVAALSAPALIVPQSVLVYSAHVSVTVQVVDDDSSVIDWCNTRVDWGDGSVSRTVGVDDGALCTASCEYEATSSAFDNIDESIEFVHDYTSTIVASPRIFVATGDGCSYTLAELELSPFTVVPVP